MRFGVHIKKRIKVIGIGGGGNNAINRIMGKDTKFVDFIGIDTDKQDLKGSKAKKVIRIGKKLTRGLGGGGNLETGRIAAEESRKEIAQTVCGADVIFIAVGMGGGIGTGAAPVVAGIAKAVGIPVIAVVTTPFSFEGHKRMLQAEAGIAKLKEECDVLVIIRNDELLADNISIVDSFKRADDILKSLCIREVAELIIHIFKS